MKWLVHVPKTDNEMKQKLILEARPRRNRGIGRPKLECEENRDKKDRIY